MSMTAGQGDYGDQDMVPKEIRTGSYGRQIGCLYIWRSE